MPERPKQFIPGLKPGRMHLWTLHTDESTDAATSCRLQEILTTDERNEALRFRRVTARQQFVMGRALVRLALSSHFAVAAGDWRFDRDCNRRPFIAAPALSTPIKFSVSHTRGLVACLTSLSAEAAVDVEKVERDENLDLAAREILTPVERKALSALSGTDWTTHFYGLWTLKEAYAKARGLGLSLPLSDIGFDLMPDNTTSTHFAPGTDDDPAAWVFWRRSLQSKHIVSVAAKKKPGEEIEIVLRPHQFSPGGMLLAAQTRGHSGNHTEDR